MRDLDWKYLCAKDTLQDILLVLKSLLIILY